MDLERMRVEGEAVVLAGDGECLAKPPGSRAEKPRVVESPP